MMSSEGMIMAEKNQLKKYREKRNFKETPEPKGGVKKKSKKPIFVIQQHDASHMHYDFRLEINGVLKSWAIPKGPSLNPAIKRLAVLTEDHPMDYANFEGVIPEGNYGGGTVMVWDFGTYENIKKISMKEGFKKGQLEFFLDGQKLHGAFALVRTNFRGKEQWLFIKMRDEYASAKKNPVTTQKKSALTGRTLRQIAKEEA